MFKRILVPLDGSKRSERAIPVAARIARASGGSIVFVNVVLPPVEFGTYSADHLVALKPGAFEVRLVQANEYLKEITAIYANDLTGIEVEIEPTTGAASEEIFSTARLEGVDLIVLCSHGETGLKRWVFSSVAQQAVRHSPVPVLVLNEHGVFFPEHAIPGSLRILVPLDGSARAETALQPTIELLTAWTMNTPDLQVEVNLLRVVALPSAYGRLKSQAYISDDMLGEAKNEAETYVKAVANRLCLGPLAATKFIITPSVVMDTNVTDTIINVAEYGEGDERGYDMIAMATHGRSGLQRVLLGSVTEHVLGHTALPLLVVRPEVVVEEKAVERSKETAQGVEINPLTAIF